MAWAGILVWEAEVISATFLAKRQRHREVVGQLPANRWTLGRPPTANGISARVADLVKLARKRQRHAQFRPGNASDAPYAVPGVLLA